MSKTVRAFLFRERAPRLVARLAWSGLLGAALVGGFAGAACTGGGGGGTATAATNIPSTPTVRLYLLSNVAGALEPCGCSKDQLGGAKYFASYLTNERAKVKDSLLLGAGPLFYQEPTTTGESANQAQWKADALATAARSMGLFAWAPAANDFGAGLPAFETLAKSSNASFLAANASGSSALTKRATTEISGYKIAAVGVVELGASNSPKDLTLSAAADALGKEVAAARADGARIVVALVTAPRATALKLLDATPGIDVLVVGKPSEKGDINDQPKPATLIGDTIVVETSNHLQTVAVLDLYLREPEGSSGRITLADAGGVKRAEELVAVQMQIRDLENRINGWEKDKNVRTDDLSARRKDLQNLKQRQADLESTTEPPATGSFFRYSLLEVRERLGEDEAVAASVLSYYKRVNEGNKVAFKDRVPQPAPEGQAHYVGVEKCTECHAAERAVWDKTPHANAYRVLEEKFVEFNLDCVSCHVTGYDQPGGSTVTHVDTLKNVQCEVCHGPGSLHVDAKNNVGFIVQKPDPKTCVAQCHHPPHVEGFDPVSKMANILGPGHGQ
ncbi:MAG: multiheme c-type cytochrome [Polyangiaceae bacterium]